MCKIINRKVVVTKNGDKFVATEEIDNFRAEADTFEEIEAAAEILAEPEFIDFVNPDGTPFERPGDEQEGPAEGIIPPSDEAKPETETKEN